MLPGVWCAVVWCALLSGAPQLPLVSGAWCLVSGVWCTPTYFYLYRLSGVWCTPTYFYLYRQLSLSLSDMICVRARRMYRSRRMYELCFRAKQGLPLPARRLTTLLLQSIIARLLRSEQVIVCAFVWMANHPHIQLYSLDATALKAFHGGLKKRITDFMKRLLALSHLSLWNENDSVVEILDLDLAVERMVYTFLNPVRAKQSKTIDSYRGFHTWNEFVTAPPDINACIKREIPWILATDIEPLSEENPSQREEDSIVESLQEQTKRRETHTLSIYPFKWLQAFGITSPKEIEAIRQRIIRRVREGEAEMAEDTPVAQRLQGYVVTEAYIPPPRERRVFAYGSTKEIRQSYIRLFREFQRKCRSCYELLKQGVKNIPWPQECFIPPAPKLCNVW